MIKDFSHHDYQFKRRIKKDYKKREFSNPYFSRVKKTGLGEFNTKLYLKIIAVIFVVYVLIYSDLFKIQTVEITGTDMISEVEFRQQVDEYLNSWKWFLLPQKNLLLLSKGGLAEQINQSYKLEKLEIDRGWQKLRINITEKINFLIIYNNEKFFFADDEGSITREISREEAMGYWSRFPILNLSRGISIGEQVVSPRVVEFILGFNEQIKLTDIAYHGYESGGESEVTLVTKAGWRAHFDVNADIGRAIENLELVLNEKIADQSKLEYIDLRFGNKVFYK